MTEASRDLGLLPADLEDGGRGPEPRNAKNADPEVGEGKGMASNLEPPERMALRTARL